MNQNIKSERELLSPPGDDIAEIIEYKRMSYAQLAKQLNKTTSQMHDIISGKEPVTKTIALQLEKALGMSSKYWLNRESNYRQKRCR